MVTGHVLGGHMVAGHLVAGNERFHELLGVEFDQVVGTLAQADQLDR
jgi:hypothetical protein